ncbi:MAG: DUF6814 family protein [Flavisolibacter sp.]
MNQLKRFLGILWMITGLASIVILIYAASINIGSARGDIGKPIPWIIIITVFTPIAIGLMIFGSYALKGEYDT